MAAGTTKWTDELFDRLQMQGDPEADAVIAEHARLGGIADPRQLVGDIARHLVLPPEKRSAPIHDYLEHRPPLPDWADPQLMRSGADFFAEFGILIGMALFNAALPESYAGARGARVLTITTRMVTDPVRRIYETAQFLIDVTAYDGLDPDTGKGYADARRVRLMHAAVRHLVLHDPAVPKTDTPQPYPAWCTATGHPINQEDLLGTLMTFTQVMLESLDKLGAVYRDEDAAAYLHTWCVTAHLLGIVPDLLPLSLDDAREITAAIRRRQNAPSEDGVHLGRALVGAMRDSMPLRILRPLPASMVRWFVGPEIAAINGITDRDAFGFLFDAVATVLHKVGLSAQHDKLMRVASRHLSKHVLGSFVDQGRGERPPFEIPAALGTSGEPLKRWKY